VSTPPDEVTLYLPRIFAEWSQVAVGPPWAGLTESQRIDFLPPLVDAMLRATVCTPPDPAARRLAVRAAVDHGRERRAQGFTEQDLVLEYYLPNGFPMSCSPRRCGRRACLTLESDHAT